MNNEYKNNTKKQIFLLLFPVACIFVAFFAICCRVYKTEGTSMSPTIEEHSRVLVIKHREIKRGDIIIFKKEDEPAIKRVIALPGERVEITEDGIIKINDKEYKESYIDTKTPQEELTYVFKVPENSYFVLGDNREDSLDSRFTSIGAIKEKDIIGKVIISLYPFKTL